MQPQDDKFNFPHQIGRPQREEPDIPAHRRSEFLPKKHYIVLFSTDMIDFEEMAKDQEIPRGFPSGLDTDLDKCVDYVRTRMVEFRSGGNTYEERFIENSAIVFMAVMRRPNGKNDGFIIVEWTLGMLVGE